jgi:hypothetical protein
VEAKPAGAEKLPDAVSHTYVHDPSAQNPDLKNFPEVAKAFEPASAGEKPGEVFTTQTWEMPAPTFGPSPTNASALSGQDAELVRLYTERQKELDKGDQGVQVFANNLKAAEPPAPASTTPAPGIETPSAAPAQPTNPQQTSPSISPKL